MGGGPGITEGSRDTCHCSSVSLGLAPGLESWHSLALPQATSTDTHAWQGPGQDTLFSWLKTFLLF